MDGRDALKNWKFFRPGLTGEFWESIVKTMIRFFRKRGGAQMKKGTKVGLLGLAAGAIGLGSVAALGNHLYEMALVPKTHDSARDTDPDDPVVQGRRWLRQEPRRRDVLQTAVDGLILHAHLLAAAGDSRRWAVCIHGYADSAESMGVYARHYLDRGWNVLLPDLRGHGGSQGDYVGFGWDDRLDIVAWISWILRRNARAEVVLHGVSMGAATALITAGGPLPANVRGVVSDCSYTTAVDIMRHVYQERKGHRAPSGPALSALRSAARRRAGYDPIKADALAAVRRSRTPTLFIHGVADALVPAAMMADLYENARCPKEFLWVPRAGHARCVIQDPELYWSTVDDFLDRLLDG